MATFAIPEDVVFNHILHRLPVISLLRFKSVCKSWYAIIKSSTFITRHLDNCTNDTIVTKHDYGNNWDVHKQEFVLLSGDKYQVSANLEFEHHWNKRVTIVVDCCNGIICLRNIYSEDIALWNPALKQLKSLPISPIHGMLYPRDRHSYLYAFGFDIKSNDYKVVRLILPHREYMQGTSLLEIYNLSSDSWRTAHKNCPFRPVKFVTDSIKSVCKNGRCFWLGCEQTESYWSLVWFDLSDEVFGAVPLPDKEAHNNFYYFIYALDLFGGKIACIMRCRQKEECQIWVLDDELKSRMSTWTVQYIVQHNQLFFPRGFVEKGESLLAVKFSENDLQGSMFLYNLATKVETPLPVQVNCNIYDRLFVLYSESLVSIK